ncbi:hypothetical protein [Micromonospora gifhornensis]|uniref:hypothetical protein n=1 Tax=Micromonospora gifhornensis TaxID=84594 RepID=UPI0036613F6E
MPEAVTGNCAEPDALPAACGVAAGNAVPTVCHRAYNRLLRGLRWQGERGFAILIGRWKTLRHTTTSPRRISDIIAAALHLIHFEYKYLPQSR